jgi:hypothetical protein
MLLRHNCPAGHTQSWDIGYFCRNTTQAQFGFAAYPKAAGHRVILTGHYLWKPLRHWLTNQLSPPRPKVLLT